MSKRGAHRKAPRRGPMRDGNPANKNNWALVCSDCGARFFENENIDLSDGHFQQEHPDVEGIHFNLVWVGKGPAPKKPGR